MAPTCCGCSSARRGGVSVRSCWSDHRQRRRPGIADPRIVDMKILETSLPGCLVIEPQVFGDARGFFYEGWNRERFAQAAASDPRLAAAGLDTAFVQSNVSRSARGVLRGLHYQWPNPQAKLVSVLDGEVWDV